MTSKDGSIGIGHAADDQARQERFGTILSALRREGPRAVAMTGQVWDVHPQVLLGEAGGEEGHDFFVGDESRKKKHRTLRRAVFLLEDSGFQPATAGGNEIRFFAIS